MGGANVLRPDGQTLAGCPPLDEPLEAVTIRNHVLTVAQRLEDALGEEQWSFIDSCPAEWSRLPIPDGPLTVGIDGGYVKAQGEQGSFEVIAGKSLLAFHRGEEAQEPVSSKCFAFVQTYDQKPKRRLFEVLQSQGHQLNQQITFLSDGGDSCARPPALSQPPRRASVRLVPCDDAPHRHAADRQKPARDHAGMRR